MTMPSTPPSLGARRSRVFRSPLLRVPLAALLGVLAALLVSCSGSGGSLIPTGDAGPLKGDFRAVAQAAENGDGSCSATESALLKTEQDFAALPSSIDAGLHDRLRSGIENLRTRALALCAQPLPQSTSSTSAPRTTTGTTSTATTPTVTQTTTTQSTPTTPPAPSGPGGGTPAPGGEGTPGAGGESGGGGAGAGEAGGAPGGAKAGGGQEAGK